MNKEQFKNLDILAQIEYVNNILKEGKTLTDDELIDKENADYKRYMRIAKRRGFDDA